MAINIEIFNSSSRKFLPNNKVKKLLECALKTEGVADAGINVVYVGDDESHRLNNQYLRHDYPTDVIAFDLGDEFLEGDIYVNIDRAAQQAEEYKVSLANEIMRLALHGALHLAGHDDATPGQREDMHELENKYLENYKNL